MARRVKYTRRADDSGWLAVLLSASRQLGFLCEYTRVEIMNEIAGRLHFRISDGNSDHVGKEASLKKENADKFLVDGPPGGPASMQVQYNGAPTEEVSPFKGLLKQQWATADFGRNHAQVTLNSVWDTTYTPIPAGTHMIMAPDQSHANISTSGYRSATPGLRCTDVWFPIQVAGTPGNSGRYVHVGHLSEGCVTVHELVKWDAVYDYLIASRVPGPDGKFVGNLIVRK
jgi:hypothetical protein